jgi:phage gp36-like protein
MKYITSEEFIGMMSHRDLDDLTDNLEQFERDNLLEQVNKDAVSEIDSYLAGRYDTQASSYDPYLTTLTRDLMHYRLYKRRDGLNLPESVQKDYQNTLKILDKIAKNDIILSMDKPNNKEENPNNPNIGVVFQTADRALTTRYTL